MSRPKKATVDYFPHFCNHKQTMFIIEQRFGNDGYAFWFKLLEMLGSAEGHHLNLNETETWEFLQAKTRLDGDNCKNILDLLSKLKAIDPDLWKKKIVWSENFIEGISRVYANRRVELPQKPDNYTEKPKPVGISTHRNPQSKVKYSKVKNTICQNSDEFRLSFFLFNKIRERKPNYKAEVKTEADVNKLMQKWAVHIKRLIEINKRTPDAIKRVIEWSQKDSFWSLNILSTEKLREKIDQLEIKMSQDGIKQPSIPLFDEDTHFYCYVCKTVHKNDGEKRYNRNGKRVCETCQKKEEAIVKKEEAQNNERTKQQFINSSESVKKTIRAMFIKKGIPLPEYMKEVEDGRV